MTYDEAAKRLFECIGDGYHIVSAFESPDAFIFTVGEEGEGIGSFDLRSLKIEKSLGSDALPIELVEDSEELSRDYLEKARRVALLHTVINTEMADDELYDEIERKYGGMSGVTEADFDDPVVAEFVDRVSRGRA